MHRRVVLSFFSLWVLEQWLLACTCTIKTHSITTGFATFDDATTYAAAVPVNAGSFEAIQTKE
jgi:hypothetical protein